jgi:predicted Zn-dependent protease
MSFQIATEKERTEALGPTTQLQYNTQSFTPLTQKTSWLSYNPDKRQSFHTYTKLLTKGHQAHKLSSDRNKVYVYCMEQELGQKYPFISSFISSFLYPLNVVFKTWTNHGIKLISKSQQYHVKDIREQLKKELPSDAYCVLAITSTDLAEDGFNYIIGKATLRDRVGVVSLARYTPGWKGYLKPEYAHKKLTFEWRCMNVLAHELCHMFGIAHCVYYECVMKGSDTGDDRPLLLCPICLKKLFYNMEQIGISVNAVQRYKSLLNTYQKYCPYEKDWIQKRIKFLGDDE